MSFRLRTIVTVLFAVILTTLTIALSAIFVVRTTSEVEETIGDELSGYAFQMGSKLDLFMENRYQAVKLLGNLPAFKNDETDRQKQSIEQMKKEFPSFSWIGVTDENGKVKIATDNILVGESIKERPVYKEALNGPFIGDVHDAVLLAKLLPNPSGEQLQFVDISLPIYDNDGNFKGVLATHLSWEWAKEIEQGIFQESMLDRRTEIFVVSAGDHSILLGPDRLKGSQLNKELLDSLQRSSNKWTTSAWNDGEMYLTGYAKADGYADYQGLNWEIIVREPASLAFNGLNDLKTFFFVISIMAIILFSLIGWVFAQFLAIPIKRISRFASHMTKERHVEMPSVRGIKEVEELATSIQTMITNLTYTERALSEMELIANKDSLTNLPNRKALYEWLSSDQLQNSSKLAVFFLDLDGFKPINDTYGHLTGDMVLIEIAKRLQTFVGNRQFAARLGGDEFVVVSPIQTKEEANRLANNIIQMINQEIVLSQTTVHVGCSIGIALYPDHADQQVETVHLADEALYLSKANGKNRATFYDRTRDI
ncbi:sensor domain-containing diguanylate cyclase [Paenisporosarcina cavernae]|uniref:Sensor domain-containing diguanylate cyclase n=1 Tax=Paenisporosarcina cavernae TaxID=2320858 RepID=A0A385YVE9_9BACL|nr:sensor domain-containing diguanylate cyclase [Paenisporosarcina cavernae]AYC30666.1 sensor domain-containing diguanylate cyclase [Paenisporosarcina cavernae]